MIHSFLLIGQSNMAGRGFLDEAVGVDTSLIKILRNGRWQPLYRPVTPDRITSGVCLAESFAEAYAKKYGVEVGLIPCADGGTQISQWLPGSLLYDHAVFQAKLAQRTSTIAGVLWHQGESDCVEDRIAPYEKRLRHVVASIRQDLQLEDVPFILGELGDFLAEHEAEFLHNYPAINKVIRAMDDEAARIGVVSAKNLGSNPDKLHFSAEALHEFGLRYFDVFEQLRDENKVFSEKPSEDDLLRTELEQL
ncbi:MAG: sialate O-acetylesterase [Oscillospiraceae bacterium]|nr:sialate O-acetylesterase [Oscillospiraceae bacterium]